MRLVKREKNREIKIHFNFLNSLKLSNSQPMNINSTLINARKGFPIILISSLFLYPFIFLKKASSLPQPITVAVKKVTDRSGAPWWKPRFEEKLKSILSTELSNAGHFIVLERDEEALADLEEERNFSYSEESKKKPNDQMLKAKYIVRASLNEYQDSYVSFDLKVTNAQTGVIAYSRSIEGKVNINKKNESTSIKTNNFSYSESIKVVKNVVPSRAIRAAINEIAEYLDCVLYIKDECISEYEAKDERRKRSNDSLDIF